MSIILDSPRDTTYWDLAGPTSFRLASRKLMKRHPFPGWGGNLQNKSERLKQIYIPDSGKIFVKRDLSGADAMIVAYLCRAGKYRQLFDLNISPHVYVAANLFSMYWYNLGHVNIFNMLKLALPDLVAHPDWKELSSTIKSHSKEHERPYYYIGKKTGHAANYKMREDTLCLDVLKESSGKIVLSKKDGSKFLALYHSLFPEIGAWHVETEGLLNRTTPRLLRTLQGYPRTFTGVMSDKLVRDAVAHVPQATVACINNEASCDIYEYFRDNRRDWDFLINEHDSILMQCPIAEEDECNQKLKDCMEKELMSPRGEKFRMRSEGASGYNWGSHSETNPNGMKKTKI